MPRQAVPTAPSEPVIPSPGTLSLMNQAELLVEYNRLSPTKRKAKFKSKEEGVARIMAIVPPAPAAILPVISTVADAPKSKVREGPTEKKTDKKLNGAKREPKNVRARQAEVVIRILTPDGANPRREETAAYDHFEKMRGGITVREYLSRFSEKDQRVARQWLWNTIKDGHVKTLGA